MIKLAIDGMGGDNAPEMIVKGVLLALEKFDNILITLYGDQTKMAQYLVQHDRLKIVHTESYLEMGEDNPIRAVRSNKDASMFLAMQAVKDQLADAVVSAGPTQALVVGGHFIIKKMSGMKRVAIAPIIPSIDGKGRMLLDSGANVELTPKDLVELAIYSSVVAGVLLKDPNPKVGLINIGTEESKGRDSDREAYLLLANNEKVNFVGNIEPKEIMSSSANILLTDGFTGNIVMKTMEGTAKAMGHILEREIKSSLSGKIGYLFMRKNLKRFKKAFDASEIGGAMLIGLEGIVIKAHGSSDAYAFYNGIRQAVEMVEGNVIAKVKEALESEDN